MAAAEPGGATDSDPEATPDEALTNPLHAAPARVAAAPCRWRWGALAVMLVVAIWAMLSLASRPSVAAGIDKEAVEEIGDKAASRRNWGLPGFGGKSGDKETDEDKDKDKGPPPTCASTRALVTDPGSEGRTISISASSEYTTQYDNAFKSRMDQTGWAAAEDDEHPWLEWEFSSHDSSHPVLATITKVQTLGREYNDGQYIKEYQLEYTEDGSHWKKIPTLFKGNQVWNKKAESEVTPAFQARKVRLHVAKWEDHPAGKVELLGCFHAETTTAETTAAASTSEASTSAASTSEASDASTSVAGGGGDGGGAEASSASTSKAPPPTTTATIPPMTKDFQGCAPDGWKWTYHAFRRVWSFVKCDPNKPDKTAAV